MCDKVICAMGVGRGSMMESILGLTAKRGRVVVTNIHPMLEMEATINLMQLTIMEKQIVGSIFGSANIHADIPKLLKLYRDGQLDLDSMVTNTYKLGTSTRATRTCGMARTSAASSSTTTDPG